MTSSLMDYAMPKADFFPPFELDRTETPTDVNPLGVKGVGETGTIALHAGGRQRRRRRARAARRHALDMPLTPERVWRAIEQARPEGGTDVHDLPGSVRATSGPRPSTRRSGCSARARTTQGRSPAGTACCPR